MTKSSWRLRTMKLVLLSKYQTGLIVHALDFSKQEMEYEMEEETDGPDMHEYEQTVKLIKKLK